MRRGTLPLLAAFCLLTAPILAGVARGELLYFARGGEIQTPALVTDQSVTLQTPAGDWTFPRSDFARVVTGYCPLREWPARRAEALRSTADARFAAAWWALENGMVAESAAMIRQSHALEPGHEPTSRLARTLDQLASPVDDPDVDPVLGALGVSFQTLSGPRVQLLHQLDRSEAETRLDLLERVVTAYYLLLAARGVDLPVPSRRLVSVLFHDQADYLTFLRSQHGGAFATTTGYYHPTYRVVVAHDLRTSGKLKAEAAALGPFGWNSTDPGSDSPDPRRRDRARRRLLLMMEWRALDQGTAAHEMIHLLVAASGLSTRPGEFPLWLHEGLAAQFEVVRGGRWAGVGRAHDLRLPDCQSATSFAGLAGLVRDEGFGHGYRRDTYARSWSLVYFLRQTRPRQFADYLDALRRPPSDDDPRAPDRALSTFTAAFGSDLPTLETSWRAFLAETQTPLQQHAPAPRLTARPTSGDRR